jgi:hypothetical protein
MGSATNEVGVTQADYIAWLSKFQEAGWLYLTLGVLFALLVILVYLVRSKKRRTIAQSIRNDPQLHRRLRRGGFVFAALILFVVLFNLFFGDSRFGIMLVYLVAFGNFGICVYDIVAILRSNIPALDKTGAILLVSFFSPGIMVFL